MEFIKKRNFEKEQWIYNIIDGISEQNKILYQDNEIVIIPNYTWNDKEKEKMHILTFPKDKTIHSIRELNSTHLYLLEYLREKTLEIIKLNYGFEMNEIKIFLHFSQLATTGHPVHLIKN